MISYKLAKQLKESGFPQKGNGFWWMDNHRYTDRLPKPFETSKKAYIPTLTELIEAVGDNFHSLQKQHAWQTMAGKVIWHAHAYDSIHAEAKTPEESVAKLWLKRNEDKKR